MLQTMYKFGLLAVLCGLAFVPAAAIAQKDARPGQVSDEAKLFGGNAISEANSAIARIKEQHRKDLWIETRTSIPKGENAAEWARKHADAAGVDGVYILI